MGRPHFLGEDAVAFFQGVEGCLERVDGVPVVVSASSEGGFLCVQWAVVACEGFCYVGMSFFLLGSVLCGLRVGGVGPISTHEVGYPLGGVFRCPLAVEGGGADIVLLSVLVCLFFQHVVEGASLGVVFSQFLFQRSYVGY